MSEVKLPQIDKLRSLRIDIATACQLKCPSCPTASGETAKYLGNGFMRFDQFKLIVEQIPDLASIELSNWGEIFLNKDLPKIMRYAYRKNIALYARNGVNFNHVTDAVIEDLVRYKFRLLKFSIDGASQEVYVQYRRNGNFDQVIHNIRRLNYYKAKYNSPFPYLRWQFIAFGHNEHEIAAARRLAADLDTEFFVKLNWGNLYGQPYSSPVQDRDAIRRETESGAADREEFSEKTQKQYETNNCCVELWRQPQINIDGRVLGCSVNYWKDYGNINQSSLSSILTSEPYQYAQKMLLGEVSARDGIPCTQCNVYKNMQLHNHWVDKDCIKNIYTPSRKYNWCVNALGSLKAEALAGWVYKLRHNSAKNEDPVLYSLRSAVHPFTFPLSIEKNQPWHLIPVLSGQTKGLKSFHAHCSILQPGVSPHTIHSHADEELLFLMSGCLDLIVPDPTQLGKTQRVHLKAGEFIYYPAHFKHTIQNTGDKEAKYMMFKWQGRKFKNKKSIQTFTHLHMTQPEDTKHPKRLFEGPTNFLKKLHAHRTFLKQGEGYAPHADPYDVAIVVIQGEVETLGKVAQPYDVIFYPAGELHGMHNARPETAKYIVFEFHR